MWEAPGVSNTASMTSKYLKVLFFLQTNMFYSNFWFWFLKYTLLSMHKSKLLHVSKICSINFQFSKVYFFSVSKHFQFLKLCSKSVLSGYLNQIPLLRANSSYWKIIFLPRWYHMHSSQLPKLCKNSLQQNTMHLKHFF